MTTPENGLRLASIGTCAQLQPLAGRPDFYLGKAARFDDDLLVRVIPTTSPASERQKMQVARLRHVRSRHVPVLRNICVDGELTAYAWEISGGLRTLASDPGAVRSGDVFFRSLVRGLADLHDHSFAHRAVRPDMVAIDDQGVAILYDLSMAVPFDFSRMIRASADWSRTPFDAPEVGPQPYDAVRADIFGAAAVGRLLSTTLVPGLIARMLEPTVKRRPSSMAAVLRELGDL